MNDHEINQVNHYWRRDVSIDLQSVFFACTVGCQGCTTGTSSNYAWQTFGDTCLTAGDGSPSTIPACTATNTHTGKPHVGGVNGQLPDPVGQGALRLTNGGNVDISRTGQIVSTQPFSATSGIQVTFTTVTYGGNGYANNSNIASGADGLTFSLIDASYLTSPTSNMVLGAPGASLGYSCRNDGAGGTSGGYLGVGIDEFGNYSNSQLTTSDGLPIQTPNAITVRGGGSVNYAALNAYNPTYYPSGLTPAQQKAGVLATCSSGYYRAWNASTSSWTSTNVVAPDYRVIAGPVPFPVPISNQEMTSGAGGTTLPKRGLAIPITYSLKITPNSLLSLAYSINGGAMISMITNQDIRQNNGPLPSSLLFGFTSSTGAGTNVHEITCFSASQIIISATTAGTNSEQSAKLQVGSQIYLAYYHPINSWGQLLAANLLTDSLGNITISSNPNWDGSCVLTGCLSGPTITSAQVPASRNIVSWDPSAKQGIAFQYAKLNAQQAAAIGGAGSGTDTGTNRISYLRGDRTKEINAAGIGTYRTRDSILGDIINSTPMWVGPPKSVMTLPTIDALYKNALPGYSSYAAFSKAYASRTSVVYVGANDGMLHGFRANNPNDGHEMIAYVPNAVINTIHSTNPVLDFSSPNYGHNSFVDAAPTSGSLFYANAWHTWIIGGLDGGGNTNGVINDTKTVGNGVLYALDVTDPATFQESNAAKLVIGEWSSSTISCTNDANCKTKLGQIFGTPVVRVLHDGNFAVIFGNGRNSANGTAGIFIMSVNRTSGAISFLYFDTGSGSTSNINWIDHVTPVDLDGDGVADYVYAGDAYGQVWRLDLTSNSPSLWSINKKVFTTASGQPITTKISVNSSILSAKNPLIILNFGTGVQFPQTLTSSITYATTPQALYGVWDWDMSTWNSMSSAKYASLPAPQNVGIGNLQLQTITNYTAGGSITTYRTVSQNPVCWAGSTTCAGSANTQFGWQLPLPNTGEQIIYNPVMQNGGLFVNTTIPNANQVITCSTQGASGFTMALDPTTGGAPVSSFFATASSAAGISPPSGSVIAGLGLNGTGTPTFVTSSTTNQGSNPSTTGSVTKQYMIQQKTNGAGVAVEVNSAGVSIGKRMTWAKLR